jgi:capsular polysaccharide export protein
MKSSHKMPEEFNSSASTLNDALPRAPAVRRSKRNVLLLQGLMGPLFRRLGQGLRQAGHGVYKINFNGGDRLFWRLPGGIDYRGTLADWPRAMADILAEKQITDVMLFGDCRDYHIPAIQACRNLKIPVHVLEEGYIRPDWVTFEIGGVNGHSSLPHDPQWFRETAASLPPIPEHRQVRSSFRRRAFEGIAYNIAEVLARWCYPHWHNHRPWPPLIEAIGWCQKLSRKKQLNAQSGALLFMLEAQNDAYFLFPLQLDSDAQIRLHSPYSGIAEALKEVIESFAAHAPERSRLVVKEHPLDNGVRDWKLVTKDLARINGVSDRVHYLPNGDIVPVARASKGMVTVNSTSGTLGLSMGIPVVVLGNAVYDIAGVTCQNGLDAFWSNPTAPDAATFAAFQRVLVERCLIPGGFFSEEALDLVVRHAIGRFDGHPLPVE